MIYADCLVGNHKLIALFAHTSDGMETTVVRWCEICGSVVVDLDCDGRILPGKLMKMRSPEIAKVKDSRAPCDPKPSRSTDSHQ